MAKVKTIFITHTDLDGVGGEILARAIYNKYSSDYEIVVAEYSNINEKVEELIKRVESGEFSKMVYLTFADISMSPELARKLDDLQSIGKVSLALFDHHKTAMWLNDYVWAKVEEGQCGTKMVFKDINLETELGVLEYEYFVKLVDDYDLWKHEYAESKVLNDFYYLIGREAFVKRMLDNPNPMLTKEEEMLMTVEADRKKRYIDGRIETAKYDGMAVMVFADQYVSELGHELLKVYTGANYAVIIDLNKRKVSLRSREGYDCSVIAKMNGGGGHPQASGFELNDMQMNRIIGTIM